MNIKTLSNKISQGSIVSYELHGKPQFAAVLSELKGKFRLLNMDGGELQLQPTRLAVYPQLIAATAQAQILEELRAFARRVEERKVDISMEDLWLLQSEGGGEFTVPELTDVMFGNLKAECVAAMQFALIDDRLFFKRGNRGFAPRKAEAVEEMRQQLAQAERREAERRKLVDFLLQRIKRGAEKGEVEEELPRNTRVLVDFAVHGRSSPTAKEAQLVVDDLLAAVKMSSPGSSEQAAFQLLCRAGIFIEDEDMTIRRLGRGTDFPDDVEEEAESILQQFVAAGEGAEFFAGRDIFSDVTAYTIDGEGTQDFDDAISFQRLEGGRVRVGVHISDVSSVVLPGTKIDSEGRTRATSIYCPDAEYPMLPLPLAHQALSLVAAVPRLTLSFFVEFDDAMRVIRREMRPGVLTVKKRLTYNEVDQLFETANPGESELTADLFALWDVAVACETRRLENGAYQFSRREVLSVIDRKGKVSLSVVEEETPSRKLVAEMMILANETACVLAQEAGVAILYRSQEAPDEVPQEKLDTVPEGPAREYYERSGLKRSLLGVEPLPHSGLGLSAYAHLTSPIRRYIDLLNQRQLLSTLLPGRVPYSGEELLKIGHSVEGSISEARTIQRERGRYWILRYLEQQKIKELKAVVVKVDGSRAFAEVELFAASYPFRTARHGCRTSRRPGDEIILQVREADARKDHLTLVDAQDQGIAK
ncbi:MAG: RNB domain-containing ribonuclease [bacterium]|nr:RNB domain-containing ribonuclease [bacterium]